MRRVLGLMAALGVDLRGKTVLLRHGGNFKGIKAVLAERRDKAQAVRQIAILSESLERAAETLQANPEKNRIVNSPQLPCLESVITKQETKVDKNCPIPGLSRYDRPGFAFTNSLHFWARGLSWSTS